jgi:hypothetical protein
VKVWINHQKAIKIETTALRERETKGRKKKRRNK